MPNTSTLLEDYLLLFFSKSVTTETSKKHEVKMFNFTITKAERNYQPGEICPEPPIFVQTHGNISSHAAINKKGKAIVNGIELNPGQRVRVTGTAHESLKTWTKMPNISVVFDWDGCDLIMFPEYTQADYQINLDN